MLEGLASGQIDIVIGTHRLLQKGVVFRDLGLLVIDEEHRFGVAHKERLKQLKKTVDVVTLTATPIPRTLQLAFAGLRDLSVIDTPPADRLAIRTQVCNFSDALIREAILRELRRGGQVFFVHNRVQTIDSFADWLRKTVPEARLAVAHGQLPERELEKKMLAFLHGEADVLLVHDHHRERPRRAARQHDPDRTAPTRSASRSSTSCAAGWDAARSAPTPIC